MSELGQRLKEERIEQGISYEKVQEMTKIRKRYIEAIEKGDYDVLPGPFYARAFIKSYAEALDLDAEKLLQEYASELPTIPTAPADAAPVSRSKRKELKKAESSSGGGNAGKWMPILVLFAFLLLLGSVIWMAAVNYFADEGDSLVDPDTENITSEGIPPVTEQNEADQRATNEGERERSTENSEENEEREEEGEDPTLTQGETSGNTTTYEFGPAQTMEITLAATDGVVWYELTDADGSRIDTEELPHGEERSWDLTEHEEVHLHIGDTQVADMRVNEETLDIREHSQGHRLLIRYLPHGEEQ